MLFIRGLLEVQDLHPARNGKLVKEIMRREKDNE